MERMKPGQARQENASDSYRIRRLERNIAAFAAAASETLQAQRKRHELELAAALSEQRRRLADATSAPRESIDKRRPRAAVVSWDLGHNPVGRAFVLYRLLEQDYNVDLVGPLWSRYGKSLWAPLADAGLNVRGFRAETLDGFLPRAEALAASRRYDLVYVCKPRLPALYLGNAIKQSSGCPMIVDVDDFELSFFKEREYAPFEALAVDAVAALAEPYEELATRYAQTLVASSDAVTVSNVALRDRFGGHIVRHARDENAFRPDPGARAAARDRLGIAEDEFALMFIGTPRPHKGVGEVARALHELDDPRVVFHVVGRLADAALEQELERWPKARVTFHDNCAFSELPALLAGADLVPLIQDPDHPISQHQIPAKVSDALSLGVPVLATATPPLADLIAQGALAATTREGLAAAIAEERRLARAARGDERARRARRAFLGELCVAVNRLRLSSAIEEARETHERRVAETLGMEVDGAVDAVPGVLAPEHERMLRLLRDTWREGRRERIARRLASVAGEGQDGSSARAAIERGRRPARRPSFLPRRRPRYDIAFFWKQNDSGLYGRRSDMVLKELLRSPRVGRIAHFDAPISVHDLDRRLPQTEIEERGQSVLILDNLLERQLGLHDSEALRARTFVSSPARRRGTLLGEPIAHRDSYVPYVREQLEAFGMRPETTIAWFCPVIWDARELIYKVGFAGVISDLIDDQRAWDIDEVQAQRLEANYRATLEESDLVFANCESLAVAMGEFAEAIEVVPNGAERFLERPLPEPPEALRDRERPLVGYVGNLRDRIDWLLLHEVVTSLPEIEFVFAGPGADSPNATSLGAHPNVRMVGVVQYDELPRWLRHFDVGIVPHVRNRMTERMNPLKIYNYFAAGLPIVSTDVSNITIPRDALQIVDDAEGFVSAIRAALERRPDPTTASWRRTMDEIAWDSRVGHMLDVIEARFRPSRRRRASAHRPAA